MQTESEAFIYYLPLPSVSRNIALAFAVFFICCFLFIPWRWGLDHTLQSIQNDPLLWVVLIAMFAPAIALFLLLAYPLKSWSARIEADHNLIRLVPKPLLRWIGEPSIEISIGSQCNRIVLCRGIVDRSHYGLRILVCGINQHQQEYKVDSASLTAHQARTLANGITTTTGVPVDLIERQPSDEGGMCEAPWTQEPRVSRLLALAKLIFAVTPLIGGLVVGFSRASGLTAVLVGIFLWLTQTFIVLISAQRSRQRSKLAFAYWLTTAFTFAASYAVVFLITVNILRVK